MPYYENVEKSKILNILTQPIVCVCTGQVRAGARLPLYRGVRARDPLQPAQHTRAHTQGPQEQPHQPHTHRYS